MSKLLEAMRAMKASDSTDEEVNEVSYNELHPVYYQIKNKLVYSATRSKVSVRQMSEAVAYLAEVMHCVKQWKKPWFDCTFFHVSCIMVVSKIQQQKVWLGNRSPADKQAAQH
ncbi:MAG: hypothetical protein KJP25_04325 [Gammaproteobacteria bacterium]|nr:hypothetical protein [Gammaproteobacteria bacterium]MBT8151988.1 hypothetical protein [Gammaproteobacteria bacterium]NND40087.1 hypothetical protein [Pseudomonadales bacterium]NNM11517.1 hypothetical protein [Pseudomonadales bacterium]RZV59569.1 MAG: hypothetical protein EX270_01380 [Pseudomonadales bacterium]